MQLVWVLGVQGDDGDCSVRGDVDIFVEHRALIHRHIYYLNNNIYIYIMEDDKVDKVDKADVILEEGSASKATLRLTSFFFTWNNYPENAEALLTANLDKYHWQPEVGKENGTPHLQGVGWCKNARTLTSLTRLFPGIHIEKMRNWHAALAYCSKMETKAGAVVTNIGRPRCKDPLEGKELYEWQRQAMEILADEPHERRVHWFVDVAGGRGKTTFAKHLCLTRPDEVIYLSGKSADCKYAVCEFTKKNNLKIVIFDFTRTQEEYISYEAIEAVKNGIFLNTKYECKMVVYDIPHVIILANFHPDEAKLSLDRWDIRDIG